MNNVTENTRKMIGCRINELLAINDVKQKELAAYLSISDNIVSYFVKGTRVPNTEQIIKISKYFNVSTDYLLGLTDVKTTDTDLKMIVDYTGLSEECIKRLNSLQLDLSIAKADRNKDNYFLRSYYSAQQLVQSEFISVLTSTIFHNAVMHLLDLQLVNGLPHSSDSESYLKRRELIAESKAYKYDIMEEVNNSLNHMADKWLKSIKRTQEHHERSGGNGKHKED
ncbi:MAG: helix-turn-helix transcriptional regulator [Eubacteriales bacterium]|nr:helix-turn-helix transcriptional regulator [Eubacteriales bacterium]